MGRPSSNISNKENRAKWNAARYAKHKSYHQVYYLKNQYPNIFIEYKDVLKQWLIEHDYTISEGFIDLINSLRRKSEIAHNTHKITGILSDLFDSV